MTFGEEKVREGGSRTAPMTSSIPFPPAVHFHFRKAPALHASDKNYIRLEGEKEVQDMVRIVCG